MPPPRLRLLLALIAIACAAFPAVRDTPEALAASATFTVTKVADTADGTCDADCSLREAITAANANANPGDLDLIQFAIPGAGPHVINVSSSLTITQAVNIMGESQSGASCAVPGRTLKIEVRAASTDFNGIVGFHSGTPGTTISGIAVTGFGLSGVSLNGGAPFTVRCSNFGIQADGVTALGNLNALTVSGSPSATIGGDEIADRNVISINSNVALFLLSSPNSVVQNNYIGTNQAGDALLGNAAGGIALTSSAGVSIRSNVIASNSGSASVLVQGNSSNATIQGNLIGYLADGVTPAAGPLAVRILAAAGVTNSGHTIGGIGAGEANRIYVNGTTAVEVILLDSGVSLNNSIRGNSIRAVSMGIALTPVGESTSEITPNDAQDVDPGPNLLQNYPVLTAVDTAGTATGTLNSTPSSTFDLDFYAGSLCSGRDGERYLGSKSVVTNASGDVSFVATGLGTFANDESVTATATDSAGNTSEFSGCKLPPERAFIGIDPSEAVAGSAGPLVTVTGVSLVDGDVVTLSGNPVATTFVSASQLQFVVPEDWMSGMGMITVGIDGLLDEATFTVTRSSSDIDCDGFASADDAGTLLRALAGLPVEADDCPDDANKSGGAADIADVLHIRLEVAGLVAPLKSLFQ